jgi:phage protein U
MSKLEKAELRDCDRKVTMKVLFNPKEFTVEKQVQWTQKEGSMNDEPPEEFTKPTPSSLTVTLHFDTYEEKTSVMEYASVVESLALIVSDRIPRPPLCMFVWGKFVFQGVVESVQQKYTMFLRNGIPVRCESTIKMKKTKSAWTGKR